MVLGDVRDGALVKRFCCLAGGLPVPFLSSLLRRKELEWRNRPEDPRLAPILDPVGDERTVFVLCGCSFSDELRDNMKF